MPAEHRHPTARELAAISCAEFEEAIKPRLRGWSHAVAAVAAVFVTIALLRSSAHDLPRFASLLVFGLSLVLLYTVSALYHIGTWRGRTEQVLLAFDHANIFVLIAGSYTPICVNVLAGWLRPAMLLLIWGLALAGIASSVLTLRVPRWAMTAMYLGMGWAALLVLPEMARLLPLEALLVLLGGGLLYTVGALVYIVGRPNPLPHLFGFHEIFHLLVVAGSAATAAMIWIWVVPFPRV